MPVVAGSYMIFVAGARPPKFDAGPVPSLKGNRRRVVYRPREGMPPPVTGGGIFLSLFLLCLSVLHP